MTLAPCPFCGRSQAQLIEMYDEPTWWFVECRACGAAGPIGHTEEITARRWNERRAPATTAPGITPSKAPESTER